MLLTEFHGTESVHLDAPAEDVFALLVDVERLPEWNAHIDHVIEKPDEPLCPGAQWVVEMRAMGTKWPSRATALTVDRSGHVFEHRSVTDDGNPSYVVWSWTVAAAERGSVLTLTWTGHPRTFWRRLFLARLRAPRLADEVRTSLVGLVSFTQAVAT
jgi:uncharacterized protein YndB with AHSA1/START domain